MNSLFGLSGKTVLITGASSGIGREVAILTSAQGAEVIITGRSVERLSETHKLLAGGATIMEAELTDDAELSRMVERLPPLDGVVFNAGVVDYMPLKFLNQSKIDGVFSVNFNSQVMLTQKLLKGKKLKKGASLVYVSSVSSKIGVPATAIYAASKGAINSYMRVVAGELAKQSIRANTVCPAIIQTPLIDNAEGKSLSADAFAKASADYPLGIGTPIDVAGPVVFLLSDASKWITGSEVIVDGGSSL